MKLQSESDIYTESEPESIILPENTKNNYQDLLSADLKKPFKALKINKKLYERSKKKKPIK